MKIRFCRSDGLPGPIVDFPCSPACTYSQGLRYGACRSFGGYA